MPLMTHRLAIDGMSCSHCIHAVKTRLEALPGVRPVEVQIGSALIESDGSDATMGQVRAGITEAGYSLTTIIPVEA